MPQSKRWGRRFRLPTLLITAALQLSVAQTDWPVYGHDPGGQQYSPLKQIDTRNVAKLQIAWTYDARADTTPPPARNRASETSPLVVGGILYIGTPYNHVVALEPETGKKIWDYEGDSAPSTRGMNYWPGDKQLAPQIVVTTMNGTLFTLNAKTGKLNPGFGNGSQK